MVRSVLKRFLPCQVTLGLFVLTQGWALHESDLLKDIILNGQTETIKVVFLRLAGSLILALGTLS